MATVDTLLVEVTADLRDVRRKLGQLEKETKRTGDRSAKNLGKLSTAVKGVIGAVVVREFARGANAAVNFASHVEEAQAKSSVVFGQFTDSVRKSLQDFGKEVGRSEFALEEMAASVQDTFVPMGIARGEAADLSVSLTKLATDVASFNNASDTETMKAFQSALVGNHETVRRFGIVITEAELQAELFAMGITKAKNQVSAAEKLQARYNLIVKGTSDAHGDAARTAESYANRVKAMNAATDRLQKALGDRLMPLFTEMVIKATELADAMTEALQADVVKSESKTIEEAMANIAKQEEKLIENANQYEAAESMRGRGRTKKLNDLESEAVAIGKVIAAENAQILAIKRSEAQQKAKEAADKAKKDEEKSKAALGEGTKFFQAQTDEATLLMQSIMGVTDAELALLEAQQGGAAFTQEQIDGYKRQAAAIDEMKLKMQGLDEVQDVLKGGVESLSSGTSQAITDMVTGVGGGMDNLKNVVGEAISSIIKKMIEMYVVNKAINAALGFFGAPQSMMLKTAASGGAIQSGRPTLVGERGPELIIPKSASVVKNAADTRGMMGGGSPVVVNQSLNFSTGVQATVRSEVMAMMPQIQESTKSAVAEQAQRGGSYTRSF